MVVAEVVAYELEQRIEAYRREAFGWFIYHAHKPKPKGAKNPTLDEWYRQWGIPVGKKKNASATLRKDEIAKANANVMKFFGAKGLKDGK